MMSKVIFALFIAVVSASPYNEVSPDFVCPEEDIAATSCMGPKDCLYPNPDNCESFIQCTVNADNKTGTPVVMPCAPATPPLQWNDNIKECDYPENSTCNSGGTTTEQPTTSSSSGEPDTTTQASEGTSAGQPSSEPTTAEPTTSSTEPSSSTSSPAPTSTEGSSSTDNGSGGSDFVCPEKDIAETSCLGPKDCLYPNPDNCESYIQCTVNADNKTGTPVVMPCAPATPPLQWNDNIKECDYPENSTCPDKGTSAQPSSTTSSPEPTTTQSSSSSEATQPPTTTTTQSSEETTTSKSTTEQPTTTSTPEETTTEQETTTEKATTTEEPTTTPQSTTTTQCVCTTTTTTITTTTTTTSSPEPTTTESSTTSEATTSEATTSEATTSEASTTTTQSPSSTTTTQSPSSTQPPSDGNFVCPPEDIINTKCLGPKDCLYQNNNDCNTFIQCTVNPDEVSGTPVVMPCAPATPPLQWNDNKKICDYPPSPTCPKRKVW